MPTNDKPDALPHQSEQASARGNRWTQHNSARQNLILQATMQLLEETTPGGEVSIPQIAERAGLARSVLYRQFNGREDLDRRLRLLLAEQVSASLEVALDLWSGSIEEIIRRAIIVVVDWESDHPRLREFLASGPCGWEEPELDGVSRLKALVAANGIELLAMVTKLIGLQEDSFETLALSAVSMVESAVSHWVRYGRPAVGRDELVERLADHVWFLIDGEARRRGIDVDPSSQVLEVVKQFVTQGLAGQK